MRTQGINNTGYGKMAMEQMAMEQMAIEQMAMEIMAMEKMAKEIMAICKIWKKWQTYFILFYNQQHNIN